MGMQNANIWTVLQKVDNGKFGETTMAMQVGRNIILRVNYNIGERLSETMVTIPECRLLVDHNGKTSFVEYTH